MDKLIGIVIAVIIAFFVWHVNHRMNVTADVRRAGADLCVATENLSNALATGLDADAGQAYVDQYRAALQRYAALEVDVHATLGGSARAVFDGLTGAEETFAAGISDGSANDPSPVRAACSGLAGGL